MLNLVGALSLGGIIAVDLVVLIGLAAIRPRARAIAFAVAGCWFVLITALAATGGFAAGVTGPLPAPVIPFLILMVGGVVGYLVSPAFRAALASVPLAAVVGIHILRILGVFFLVLHAQGHLGAPFATSAGWGDIITGVVAIPLALMVWKGTAPRWLLALWNAFGALDLVTAIALGAMSAPGTPFNIFTEAPGTMAMTTLPWVIVPTSLVPLYMMTHVVIAARLRKRSNEELRSLVQRNGLSAEAAVRRIA
jgi:hypothetical protein